MTDLCANQQRSNPKEHSKTISITNGKKKNHCNELNVLHQQCYMKFLLQCLTIKQSFFRRIKNEGKKFLFNVQEFMCKNVCTEKYTKMKYTGRECKSFVAP